MGRSSLNMSLYAENPPKIETIKKTYFRQRQPEIRLRSQAKKVRPRLIFRTKQIDEKEIMKYTKNLAMKRNSNFGVKL